MVTVTNMFEDNRPRCKDGSLDMRYKINKGCNKFETTLNYTMADKILYCMSSLFGLLLVFVIASTLLPKKIQEPKRCRLYISRPT